MKSTVKNTILGLFFAAIIALLVDTVELIDLKPIPVFALLALLVVISKIKNQWLSFAVVTAVSAGMTIYDSEYAVYCLPYVIIVWSAMLCKNEKISPIFTILAQAGFAVSLYYCYVNRNTEITLSNFFIKMNKFTLVPIVIVAFVILQNYQSKKDEDSKDGTVEIMPIEKSKKTLMTCAYVWSVIFLLDMSIRFYTTINATLLWICSMCYVMSLEEPMLYNAFPTLKTLLNFGADSNSIVIDGQDSEETSEEVSEEELESVKKENESSEEENISAK